jgi:hypothetical protein
MVLYEHLNIINRAAIDEFFAARVARQKGLPCEMRRIFHRGLRPSAIVCGFKKIILKILLILSKN